MGHKLEDNGLWESSRMILPEQLIAAVVAESYRQEVEATFEVFDPFEPKEVRGVVTRVNQQLRRFRVGEDEWIKFSEVIKARN